jgi:DNA-binding MarR family transcriptional regulator
MNQLQINYDPPSARRTDPDTSHEAARRAGLGASEGRKDALHYLSRGPCTDFELAARSGYQQTSIGKRRGELVQLGLVVKTNERRPSPSGSPAIVWAITDAGRKALGA